MKLKIANTSNTYSNGVRALKNVTLTIPNGIYDHRRFSGVGKSKLMHFFLLLSSLVIALVVGTTAYSQDKTSKIDKIFS